MQNQLTGSTEARLGRDILLRACRNDYGADPELQSLLKWHHAHTVPRRLSWAAAGRELGLDPGVIFQAWRGGLNGEAPAYKAAVKRLRAEAGRAGRPGICETRSSRIIWEAHEVAAYETQQGKGSMVYIRGPSGAGKTFVSKAWCRAYTGGQAIFAEPKGWGGSKQLLYDLGGALGLNRSMSGNSMLNRVFDSLEPGTVVVEDEIALLVRANSQKQPQLDLLRRLPELTGCALIVLATEQKFENDLRTSDWDDVQWWRRQSRIIDLPDLAEETDVVSLFRFKLPGHELHDKIKAALLAVNAHRKGGFGQVAKILDDAIVFAQRAGRKPTDSDLATCAKMKFDALDAVEKRTGRR